MMSKKSRVWSEIPASASMSVHREAAPEPRDMRGLSILQGLEGYES